MIKDSVVLYTKDRIPLSLGNLNLYNGKFIEDIFDAVEDSENFTELDSALRGVIANPLTIDRITPRYIRYKITNFCGNMDYLKIKIKNEGRK